MEISTDKKELKGLIEKTHSGEIVLPQFQRNFVWGIDDIEDLLKSLLKGYFIGNFLLLRVDKDNIPFSIRAIAGLNLESEELKPEFMILDGQQRITALYYCLYAPNIPLKKTKHAYKFFLDLNKFQESEIEDAVWSKKQKDCKKYDNKDLQFKELQLPLTEILNWENWKSEYAIWLDTNRPTEIREYLREIEPRWTRYIDNIRKKLIPYIEIPKVKEGDEIGVSEICAVFEKMNSTGVNLGVYDLLTARLYKYREQDIDIHSLWEKTLNDYPLISEFSERRPDSYGIFILRIIALKRNIDPKGKNIINFKPEDFKTDWDNASKYLESALMRIKSTNEDGFGVFDKKWFPYPPMIVVFAAILWKIEEDHLEFYNCNKYIKKWYWGSVFFERYNSAIESKTYSDFVNLYKKFKTKEHNVKIFDEFETRFPTLSLIGVTNKNARYKGVMNIIALASAKDFISGDSIEFYELNDHHIFPDNYLDNCKNSVDKAYQSEEKNTIVNHTLICSKTNKKISNLSPKEYIDKYIPIENRKSIMKTHLIDEKSLVYLQENNFELFKDVREKIILSKIKELAGFKSDVEASFDNNPGDVICNFEKDLRKFIDDVLIDDINGDWWKTIPSNIKEIVATRIENKRKKEPLFDEKHYENNLNKLKETDLEHLRQIITSKWDEIFKKYFKGSPEDFTLNFKNIINLRNELAHSNMPQAYIRNLGVGSLEKLNMSIKKIE